MNILFTINKSFIDKLIDCIHSIERFPGEYDIYVVHSELEDKDISLIQEVSGKNLHIKNIVIDKKTTAAFPVTERYSRLFRHAFST
ncbi:MAG: hypothetical protein LUC97_04135 [Clostridiales bacterium]|nr:hypothetical protein [Clostridiales bacterium]